MILLLSISFLHFGKGAENTLTAIDTTKIKLPIATATIITLTFQNDFTEYPSKIGIVESNTKKVVAQYNTLTKEDSKKVKFTIPTTVTTAGAYLIQVVLENENYICALDKIIYIYKDEEIQLVDGGASINVINPTLIDYIKITFKQEVFAGRLEIKQVDNIMKYSIEPTDNKSIRLNVENKIYTAKVDYVIKDLVRENDSSKTFSVNIKADSNIAIDKNVVYYASSDTEKPIIKITPTLISQIYAIVGTNRIKLTKNDGIYEYSPSSHNEVITLEYQFTENGNFYKYGTQIIVFNNVQLILSFSLDSCLFKGHSTTITITPVYSEASLSLFDIKFGKDLENLQKIVGTQTGEYTLPIPDTSNYIFVITFKDQDTSLYTQTVTATEFTLTDQNYYTSSARNKETIEITAKCGGGNLLFQNNADVGKTIPINCDASTNGEKIKCYFQSFLIEKYGAYTLYYGTTTTNQVLNIYKTLSEVDFNIKISPFPLKTKDTAISIETNDFDLTSVSINIKKNGSSNVIECKQGGSSECKTFTPTQTKITFSITLADEFEKYIITSITKDQLTKTFSSNLYVITETKMSIALSKSSFLVEEGGVTNKEINFVITPKIPDDFTFEPNKITISSCTAIESNHCKAIPDGKNYQCRCNVAQTANSLSLIYTDTQGVIATEDINIVSYKIELDSSTLSCLDIASNNNLKITIKSKTNKLSYNANVGNINIKFNSPTYDDGTKIYSYLGNSSVNKQTILGTFPLTINGETISEANFYKIHDITQNKFTLYNEIKQNLILQFSKSISANTITKLTPKKEAVVAKDNILCTDQNKNGITFSCEVDLTTTITVDDYTLFYTTNCGVEINTQKTIKVVAKPNLISSVNPTYLASTTESRDIKIIYTTNDNIDDIESITLINIENVDNKITLTTTKLSTDTKTLIISPSNNLLYGKFILQTNYKQSSNIASRLSSSEITLTFYDKEIAFKDTSSNISVFDNYDIKGTIILFDNERLGKHQIKSVVLETGNASLDYSIVNSNSIKIESSKVISAENVIAITDFKDGTPIKKTIKVQTKPTTITGPTDYYIYNPNITPNEIKVQFNQGFEANTLSSAITTENGFSLTFKDSSCSADTPCTLIFIQSDIPSNFNNINTKIIFTFSEGENNPSISTSEFLLINKNNLPTKLFSNPVYIKSGETDVIIKLNQSLSLFTQNIVNTLIKTTDTSISFSIENDSLKATNNAQIDSDKSFPITINDISLTVDIKILKCKLPTLIYKMNDIWGCYSCGDLDSSKPFFNSEYTKLEPTQCAKECPFGSFIYYNQCLKNCALTSLLIEGNKCVMECSNGYGKLTEGSITCVKCSEHKLQDVNHMCVDGCPKGTLLSTDGKCYLPGDLYLTTTENKCETYGCNEIGTDKCEIEDDNPKCICKKDYYGILCDTEKSNTQEYITSTIDTLFPNFVQNANEIKYNDINFRFKIKDVATIIENSPDVEITDTQHLLINTATEVIVNDFVNKNEAEEIILPNENLLDLIGLAVHSKMIKNDTEKLSDLVGKAAKINFKNAVIDPDFSNENSVSIASSFNYFSNQRWTNDPKSLSLNSKNAKKSNQTIIDFSPTIKKIFPSGSSNSKYMFVNLDIHPNITKIISNISSPSLRNLQEEKEEKESITINSNSALFKSYIINDDGTKKEIIIDDNENYIVKFPPIKGIDMDKYVQYKSKGLDIYDPTDDAFLNSCYWNDELDYDLPQVYRKKQLYTGKTFKGDICTYQGLDLDLEYIIMKCQKGDIGKIGYSIVSQTLNLTSKEINHKDNLPIKCGSQISVHNNIAFWLFLILFTLFIAINIVMILTIKFNIFSGSINDLLRNDKLESIAKLNQFTTLEMGDMTPKGEESKEEVNPKHITVEVKTTEEKKDFVTLMINNFKELHPLLTLYRSSAISPIIYTQWIFFYNLLNLFGFNALYFTEEMLEDRIEDEHRANFGYPMKTEFEKIMASISTAIALTLVVRGIILVTYQQKEDLSNKIQSTKNEEEKKNIIVKFTNSYFIRRIIGMIFMLILEIFFWYYTIVFCGIYEHTQYGWFYSGLWSLFMNWVCFAPFYILFITALEFAGDLESCTYYMKRFFIF